MSMFTFLYPDFDITEVGLFKAIEDMNLVEEAKESVTRISI